MLFFIQSTYGPYHGLQQQTSTLENPDAKVSPESNAELQRSLIVSEYFLMKSNRHNKQSRVDGHGLTAKREDPYHS